MADLISRKVLLAHLQKSFDAAKRNNHTLMAAQILRDIQLVEREEPVDAAKPAAHWEHIIEQKPEFDAVGRYIGISETPKTRCSHCKQTNKNYESPFCPHCGYQMTKEV